MMRVRILCEDRRAERFVRALCTRYGVVVPRDGVMPVPKDGGCNWVLRNYAREMKRLRSKNYQRNLGLIVHVDGDAYGVLARKRDLDARLTADGQAVRANEPVAIFVPTWSIESWLLHLSGLAHPAETDQIKRGFVPAVQFRSAVAQLERDEAGYVASAAGAWSSAGAPQSLADGRVEGRRVGLP